MQQFHDSRNESNLKEIELIKEKLQGLDILYNQFKKTIRSFKEKPRN